MFRPKRLIALLSHPFIEQTKGAIKGQVIRLKSPKRYKELKKMRPSRLTLVRQKRKIVAQINQTLHANNIRPISVFGRVKTMGSLDRKERYARLTHPERIQEYLYEDLIGITVVLKDKANCYATLQAIKKLGSFPTITGRNNPRDYFKNPGTSRGTTSPLINVITGNLLLQNKSESIHIMLFTPDSYIETKQDRRGYLQEVQKK